MHVRVDRDEERRRRHRPEPEVHPVRGPDDPAQVEQQALAGAAGAGVGHEVAQPARRPLAAERVGEAREPLAQVAVRVAEVHRKARPERAVGALERAGRVDHARDVAAAIDPVDEARERRVERVERALLSGA